jgi:hypothetical protein
VKGPEVPRLDTRRTRELRTELLERARAWIPSWDLSDEQHDLGKALLDVAARFSAEVTERLDGAGEKMRRGFLDWLAVRGDAARPSRVPVVFKLTDSAQDAVLADAPIRLQVDTGGVPVAFETEQDVRVIPGGIASVVAVDADADAFYLPAPGLSDLQPLEPLPVEWELKTFAAASAKTLQVTPDTGLAKGMFIEAGGRQYEIEEANGEIVKITVPLSADLPPGTLLRKVTVFTPFEAGTQNQQEHALYLGHMELLNIEAAATIDIVGLAKLDPSAKWQYWGKRAPAEASDWQTLEQRDAGAGALVLEKPAGAVEVKDINGISSRWLRAYMKKVDGAPTQVDTIELRINSTAPLACPPAGTAPPPLRAEGMANATPLVLTQPFLPLGKEPRQFDAFYLGSEEAFSKKGASVQLCFELADPSFQALSAVRRGGFLDQVAAGVGRDRALHLFTSDAATGSLRPLHDRDPVRPPLPGFMGTTPPGDGVTLDSEPPWRLPVFTEPGFPGFLVGVAAGDSVWVWVEHPSKDLSGWFPFGQLPVGQAGSSDPIDGLVFLRASARMVALRGGKVFVRDWPFGPAWNEVTLTFAGNPVTVRVIAPIFSRAVDGLTTDAGFLAISDAAELLNVTFTGSTTATGTEVVVGRQFTAVEPVGFANPGGLTVVAVLDASPPALIARDAGGTVEVDLGGGTRVVQALDFSFDAAGAVMAVACLQNDASQKRTLATWTPFGSAPQPVFETAIPDEVGGPSGPPTIIGNFVMVPTFTAAILVARVDLSLRTTLAAPLRTALVVPASSGITTTDFVAIPVAPTPSLQLEPVPAGVTVGDRTLFEFDVVSIDGEVSLFRASQEFNGVATSLTKVTLSHTLTGEEGLLLIETDKPPALYKVSGINPATKVATLASSLQFSTAPTFPVTVKYRVRERMSDAHWPLLRPSGANANWDPRVLDRTALFFPGPNSEFQAADAFKIDAAGHPELVVLRRHFDNAPSLTAGSVAFIVNGAIGTFAIQLGDSSANPELSWEYSDGKGWSGLNVTLDTTRNLKVTGVVQFKVPAGLAPSDWAGKTNHWIRARLIGGDYGREKVTVTSVTNGNTTTQNVHRSTDGIRAPSVVSLHITYRLSDEVRPTFVLAQDSGSYRDQSDANRTGGAMVEAFVSLAVMLGRLAGTGAPPVSTAVAKECPPNCQCHGALAAGTDAAVSPSSPAETGSLQTARPATGRTLFLGLSAPPTEAPVNALLLVDREHDYSGLAPMAIEALVADRLVPIVADDTTRALGESGVLSMAFAVPPTPREMFGKTLSWLQLRPRPAAGGASGAGFTWSPALRGAYLNAVWASATETMTRELLGSSDGAPRMTFTVARPPLLKDSLELRVREPLGDEERADLRSRDDRLVLTTEDPRADWVLWTRVVDPADEGPDARVYGLDEATGRITFGDGLHGMIPPIGRDSIVAFSYQRTETGADAGGTVPGNTVAPRAPFNLVSPVEGVETVIAADQAAGGAPPESDDRVLRFGFAKIRHRRRAVTARDVEDLTLQSSPDVVQARCLMRRGYARLIVVMRGARPQPNASQVRELRRLLLEVSPVALAAPGALRIEGPAVRKLRIELTLRIPTLDQAGDVGRDVKKRVARLFDTAEGGADGQGWPLGTSPGEGDIAYALMDIPGLESVAQVNRREAKDRRSDGRWPESLKPNELAVLADDPVRLSFVTAEATV